MAVAVTVGSFSDPEAAEGKKVRKAGDSLIHRKNHEFSRRGFLDHRFFFQHFCWPWNNFFV